MESRLPHLVLEEIEHHLSYVRCFGSNVELHFPTEDNLAAAAAASYLGAYPLFLAVTSHLGCNDEGKRETYL